ncbi:MAG: RDD family protein [Gammaproteobacteria bacterium]|nr:MAG: RDD family protein [Gammaproteobacteria bacterium]RKZ92460.1 MAG: RDD family protein [Gammaproteobacteria bacterium]RLA01709.1 MAG: RDD family protein [Gammaproteobacteria bacterium]HHA18540.1 RDD family protein [Methylophaga sp.]
MTNSSETYCRPSIFRHLIIIIYDSLLLMSVLLLAGLIAVASNSGEAISQGNPFFISYLFGVSFIFYGWFWTHGGQTLGMRSWKVRIITIDGSDLTWQRAFIRFTITLISWLPLGIGFWWQYLAKDRLSWADKMSDTQLHYSKNSKPKPLSRLS